MTRRIRHPQARPGPRAWLGSLLVAVLLAARPVAAQVPADTLRPDSAAVRGPPAAVEPDTLPADSTAAPPLPPRLVRFPRLAPLRSVGFAAQRWEWDRDALLRFHGPSLLELIARTPGLTVTRTGDFGAPAGVSVFGGGGGRVRVFLDGFELATLGSASEELQRFSTGELEAVRVERTPAELRVELYSYRLPGPQPYSIVEAAGGTYGAKGLHALLARPIGARSVVTASYDDNSTRGFGFVAPFGVVGRRVGWTYSLRPGTALHVEYRGESVKRTSTTFPLSADYSTLLLRARTVLTPGFTVDASAGRTRRSPKETDPFTVALSTTQLNLRAGYESARAVWEGGLRARSGVGRAVSGGALELYTNGGVSLLPRLSVEGDARLYSGVAAALAWSGTVRAGGSTGPGLFATLGAGDRPVSVVRDSAYARGAAAADTAAGDEVVPVYTSARSSAAELRAGAEWIGDGVRAGVAAVLAGAGTVVPFGLGFDDASEAAEVGAARGLEARFVAPIAPGGALRLDGAYSLWLDRGGRPYLPAQEGRAALTFHGLYFDSQLEPTLRLELDGRGPALGPTTGSAGVAEAPAYALLNFFLQIRILDVRAFLRSDNVFNYRLAQDLPGRFLPGARLLYGVRWVFRG